MHFQGRQWEQYLEKTNYFSQFVSGRNSANPMQSYWFRERAGFQFFFLRSCCLNRAESL